MKPIFTTYYDCRRPTHYVKGLAYILAHHYAKMPATWIRFCVQPLTIDFMAIEP